MRFGLLRGAHVRTSVRVTLSIGLLGVGPAHATIRQVPQVYPTIQGGISAAVAGDTVLVGPGTYLENVNFTGKAIRVASSSGRATTFIQPADPARPIVRFASGEDSTSVLHGFTIRYTTDTIGVVCLGASPKIQNCDISYCVQPGFRQGAGLFCLNSGAKIRYNRIHHNSGKEAAGIGVRGSSAIDISYNEVFSNGGGDQPAITGLNSTNNAEIHHNVVYDHHEPGCDGTGIYCWGSNNEIYNNTVFDNDEGIFALIGNNTEIRNNIVVNNPCTDINEALGTADYNNEWFNEGYISKGSSGTNLSVDPQFVDFNALNLTLESGSPCIDAGHFAVKYNDPDGSRNDLGAIFPPQATLYPVAADLAFAAPSAGDTVLSPMPEFQWSYSDTASTVQAAYEVEVGSFPRWSTPPLWSTGAVSSTNTFATYQGPPLANLTLYYVRVRVLNGSSWGHWRQRAFFTHFSNVIQVPGDRSTIQAAIEAAQDGDTILVGPGTYGNFNFLGKRLVVKSVSGPDVTTVFSYGFTVVFASGEDSLSVLDGFRVGNTVYCAGSSPIIKNCELGGLTQLTSTRVYCQSCGVRVLNNRIHGARQPAVEILSTSVPAPEIAYNDFYSNMASQGPAIRTMSGASGVSIHHNLFRGNVEAQANGGTVYVGGTLTSVVNNTVVDNTTGIRCGSLSGNLIRNNIVAHHVFAGIVPGASTLDYNATWGNGSGNTPGTGGIVADPLFADLIAGNYGLQPGSPCIDAGHPDAAYNDSDGTRSDIGAGPGVTAPIQLPKIRSFFPGSLVAPQAQFVELGFPGRGRQELAGQSLSFFGDSGALLSVVTIPADLSNGANQASVLFATLAAEDFFGVSADVSMPDSIDLTGGKICFGSGPWDCVSWGAFSGSHTGSGTPFRIPFPLAPGAAVTRTTESGIDSLLEDMDDTDNSATDFEYAVPAPRNNAGAIGSAPPSVCGNGILESLESCDDGNTVGGDGCQANCGWQALCTIVLHGDVNASGSVTSADIIRLVNFVFIGGTPPQPCTAAGDVNCSRTVTSSDIIALINYVFKSAAPPCDICPLIRDGTWACP